MAVSLSKRKNPTFETLPMRIGKAFNVTERWQRELFSHNSVASLTSSRGLRLLLPLPPGTRPNKWQAQATPELEEIFGIFEPFCLLGNQGCKFCFFGSYPKVQSFFWLPKRVNHDMSCITTKVRKS